MINQMPKTVAIITVTYNRAHILAASVDSVLSQDYPDLRLLIVDDGSTDGTDTLLGRFDSDPRVEIIRHEVNRGVTAARNTALDHLGSEVSYLGYNDSDDMLVPGAVGTAVQAIESHGPRYSMVYAMAADVAGGVPQGAVRSPGGAIRTSGDITADDYLAGRLSGDFFQLVRRDLLGDMRHEMRANGGEGVLWARMLRMRPALLIPAVLQLKDRAGTDRLLRYRYDSGYARGKMWSLRHEIRYLGGDMRRLHPQRYADLLQQLSHHAAMAGERRLARQAARQALRMDPSAEKALLVLITLAPGRLVRQATRMMHRSRAQGRRS